MGYCPVPVMGTIRLPPVMLPEIVTSPLIAPGKDGESVTVTAQVPSDASVDPQVVVIG